jgi:hypothetical protein
MPNPTNEDRLRGTTGRYSMILVGGGLGCGYFILIHCGRFLPDFQLIVFHAPDATAYRAVADWMLGISSATPEALRYRPFFYPLLLNLLRLAGGDHAIWLGQYGLWWATGILLYRSIRRSTANPSLALAGTMVYSANLTVLLLTMHALAETTACFLLAVWVGLLMNRESANSMRQGLVLVLLTSLLTVTKPVYQFLLVASCLDLLARWHAQPRRLRWGLLREKSRPCGRWVPVIGLLLAISPVLVQIGIMKIHFGTFSVSEKGPQTFKRYFIPLLYGMNNRLSVNDARQTTSDFTTRQSIQYTVQHIELAGYVWLRTIRENLIARPHITDFPTPHPRLTSFMAHYNIVAYHLHLIMLLPVVSLLIWAVYRKEYIEARQIALLSFAVATVLGTAGISFWQADRIVAPVLPVWIALYLLVMHRFVCQIRKRIGPD